MSLKIRIVYTISCITIGFALGKISLIKPHQKVNLINQNTDNKKHIITNNDIQDNIKSNEETITTQKIFSKTGKIKKEIQTQIVYNYVNLSNKKENLQEDILTKESKLTKNSLTLPPPKNWSISSFVPISQYKNYSDYTVQISYRLIGEIWISGQTDVALSRPMIGIGVEF